MRPLPRTTFAELLANGMAAKLLEGVLQAIGREAMGCTGSAGTIFADRFACG